MERISSKDRILDSALDLFSEKGYVGIGVDQIAQNIGLKGPSIYKHFKGKEDILQCLMERADAYYAQNFGSANNLGDLPQSMEALIEISMKRISFTVHDPAIRKVRRLTTMEQFRSPMIAEITTRHGIQWLQSMYSRILSEMMEAGTVKKDDPDLLALQLISPVSLMIQVCDRQPEYETQCMDAIRKHLNHFAATYGVNK